MGAAVIALAALATVAGIVGGVGNPALAVAPVLVLALVFVLAKLPLRWSATALAFLLLALELKTDAEGIWTTPLVVFGELLYFGLGRITRLNMAGFEVLIVFLCGVALWRRRSVRSPLHVPVPSATRDVLVIYLCGVFLAEGVGLMNGFGVVPWKIRYLLHGCLFFCLFQTAYRNHADFRPLGGAFLAAAHVKAVLAIWVQLVVAPRLTGGMLATATNHGDSVLFAMAVLIAVVPALESPSRRSIVRAVLLVALPVWGIVLNGRRLAWGMLAMSMVTVFFISPWRPWKRRLVQALLIGAPIVGAYVWIGWNHAGSGLFSPVAQLRSMIDSKNPSTYWREVEAWNITTTIQRTSPVGKGLGGEYVEYMFNDSIADVYPDYRGWPHNTVLGLMLLAGPVGFIAIFLLYALVVYLAVRAYRHARATDERIGALLCVGAVVCCVATAWGDTGAHFLQFNLTLGAALALAGKLALTTGGWPGRASARAPATAGATAGPARRRTAPGREAARAGGPDPRG